MWQAGPGWRASDVPKRSGVGTNFLEKQLKAQGPQILTIVTVVGRTVSAMGAGFEIHPPAILIDALAGALMDKLDLRSINAVQSDTGLALLDLRLHHLMKVVQ